MAKKIGQLRSAMIRVVKPRDVRVIVQNLVRLAVGGDVASTKLLFSYLLGPPVELDLLQRIESLEAIAEDIGTIGFCQHGRIP